MAGVIVGAQEGTARWFFGTRATTKITWEQSNGALAVLDFTCPAHFSSPPPCPPRRGRALLPAGRAAGGALRRDPFRGRRRVGGVPAPRPAPRVHRGRRWADPGPGG